MLDTLKEITTITVQVNEAGDTLKQSIVTDRLQARTRSQTRDKRSEVRIVRDTVYVEKSSELRVDSVEPGKNVQEFKSSIVSALKWIFAIICAIIVLIITIRIALRRAF